MDKKNILAHRGWWLHESEKNSFTALERAIKEGFGIETDVRDLNSILVISHDPASVEALTTENVIELYAKSGALGRLALNIKADGLEKLIFDLLNLHSIDQNSVFAFDMSVPDSLNYFSANFPVYTRASEFEEPDRLLDSASGVWVDNFTGSYTQIETAIKLLAKGKRCCIVSSELHGRPHMDLWRDIAAAALHKNPMFEICTDYPDQAFDFFGKEHT